MSSKDKENESLKLELTSLKETIENLNRENSDLKSRISSVNDLVLSTQKRKIDPIPHSEEFFEKVKFQIRTRLRRVIRRETWFNSSGIIYDINEVRKVLDISENEVKSPILKYSIRKVEKYYKNFNIKYTLQNLVFTLIEIPIIKETFAKEIGIFKIKCEEDNKFLINKYFTSKGISNMSSTDPEHEKYCEESNKLSEERVKYLLSIFA